MRKKINLGMFILALAGQTAYARSEPPKNVADDTTPIENADSVKPRTGSGSGQSSHGNWLGLNLGVGLSVTFDNGQDRRIESAIVDENGIVRVTDEENSVARILLEGHYFFPCDVRHLWKSSNWSSDLKNQSFLSDRCGFGPFVAIQPGENEIVDAAAIGLMFGFKYTDWSDRSDNSSFNLGVGLVVDPNGQILGDGIEENQPLPGDETEVRFKEKQQYGWLVLASFSF